MKLNVNCIRDVLLELEKLPFQQSCSISNLTDALPKYEPDDITYTCLKLAEAGYINIKTIQNIAMSNPIIRSVEDITYEGHQFLANIRSDTVWSNIKEVSKKVGSNSISAISQIATGVITEIIKAQLGLP